MRTLYYSKVILFGEYSMIFDATALMVPLQQFSASWKLGKLTMPRAKKSNESICLFRDYLAEQGDLKKYIDIESLSKDLRFGLNLASNVPSGYGLGSS
ncbi:MAG: mevalonate kinase, partial [bacterium]|nr:mevalonate kinase [Candidatus Limimorpha equi]